MTDREPSSLPLESIGPLLEIAAKGIESQPAQDHPALQQAELLGYHMACPLGAGGLAEVWRCYREDHDREYALKTARQDQPDTHELIRREAEVLSECAGPGVVKLEAQEGDDEHRFLILEFIDGDSLNEYVACGSRSTHDVANLIAQVCRIVARVHRKGYLHGDLKPANILIRADDQEPILIDFGLACRQNAQGAAITGDLHRGGTDLFMAPEYRHEAGWLPTIAGDIFALGKTLEFLLDLVDAPLPKPLQRIVKRACHPDPACRFATPSVMADALNVWSSPQRRSFSMVQRFGAVAALLVTIGTAAFFLPTNNTPPPAMNATAPANAAANPFATVISAIAADQNTTALRQLDAFPETQRGWEWRHLWSRASLPPSVTHLVFPHPGTACAIDPSGSQILVGTHDRQLFWIDFDGHTTPVSVPPQFGPVAHAVVRTDGTLVAADMTGRVWQETPKGLQTVIQLPQDRPQVCWPAADDTHLYFWSHISQNLGRIDLATRRWDNLRQSNLVLPAPSSPGASLAVDRKAPGFAATLLDRAGAATMQDNFPQNELPTCVDVDPHTGQAVVGTNQGNLRVYHLDGTAWHTLTLRPDEAVTAAVITSDEARLFAADDLYLYVVDLDTGQILLTLPTNTPGLVRDIHWDRHTGTLILATDLGATQWKAADYNTILASR